MRGGTSLTIITLVATVTLFNQRRYALFTFALVTTTATPVLANSTCDFPCGRKPEYPENAHGFQQIIDLLYTFTLRLH